MHQGLKLALIGSSLLFTAPAFAQDAPAGDATATGTGDATAPAPDPNAAGTTPTVTATPDAGAAGTSAFSATGQLIDQQYVADKGKVGAFGDVDIAHLSVSGGGVTVSATQEGLNLGAGYGITDKITAGLEYAFPVAGDGTDDTKFKGPLTIFGNLLLAHSDKMTVAVNADFEYDMCGGFDADGCVGTKGIHAGLGLKYRVAPKFAVFTGSPFGPGPVGQHLSISLESSGPITFELPVGAGFQATPQIFAFAETNLALFRLANAPDGADAVSPIFSDAEMGGIGIPLALGGFFGVNKQLHVGAQLSFPDLAHAGDLWGVTVGARFYN
jgi:hypothetical protein